MLEDSTSPLSPASAPSPTALLAHRLRLHYFLEPMSTMKSRTKVVVSAVLAIACWQLACSGSDSGGAPGDTDASGTRDGGPNTGNDASNGNDGSSGTDASTTDAGGGTKCSGAASTFSGNVRPIIKNCGAAGACHGGLAQGSWPYEALVNVKASRDVCSPSRTLVVPGKPDDSYLLNKLTGNGMCPGGKLMPSPDAPLAADQIQVITDWICAGAKND